MTRCFLIAVGLLLAGAPAFAGRNAGGALIVHTNDAYMYRLPGLCQRFETIDSPGSCELAGTQTNRNESTPALIWIIAAFPADADPSVTRIDFGLSHNLPVGLGYFANWNFCGPAGSWDSPDGNWPDEGGNTLHFAAPVAHDLFFPSYVLNVYGMQGAFVGTSVHPNLGYAAFHDDATPPVRDPCLRFGQVRWYEPGYNDCPDAQAWACCFPDGHCELRSEAGCAGGGGSSLPGELTCDPNPCLEIPGACCLANGYCELRTLAGCEQAGGVFLGIDIACEPNRCTEVGACCFLDGSCQDVLPENCLGPEGFFQGAGSACAAGPCSPAGACCLADASCEIRFEPDCLAAGGVFLDDFETCDPSPCVGACCLFNGNCLITTAVTCVASYGEYLGPGYSCEPNPCETAGVPDPEAEQRTWGQIKAGYR